MTLIRPAKVEDAAAIARVHVASWRTSYAGIVAQSVLDGLDVAAREERWQRILAGKHITHVAETDAGIVGFASGGPERDTHPAYDGELYAIYLLQQAQRGGVGRKLVRAVVDDLIQAGYKAMLVWVLRENLPARHFYEKLGGQFLMEKDFTIGDTPLVEVAYGWLDISRITSR